MKKKSEKPIENWIDYLEGELDPTLREDFDKLLSHSKVDEKNLNDLKRLRSSLQHADQQKNLEFNQRLFDNIQMEINKTLVLPKWRTNVLNSKRFGSLLVLALISAFTFSFVTSGSRLLSYLMPGDLSTVVDGVKDSGDLLIVESVKNPEELALTMNSHKSDEDLVFDKLAYQTENLSDEQLNEVMEKLLN